ncbi:MAG: 30S ribosome-binding factor RbfA [Planctomycetota bacterium]|jgi:ribosome-binding factor A
MASPLRRKRVAERVKQEVGEILLSEIKDPRMGMISVTRVKISPDLRSAGIFVSILGDEAEKHVTMQALKHARGYIQTQVAKRIDIRFAPIIKFHLDESIEKSIRVSKILDDLARERGEDPAADLGGTRLGGNEEEEQGGPEDEAPESEL